MPFRLVKGDILNVKADAVVNAANNLLMCGGGVCGAIFAAAGEKELSVACADKGFCETGSAVITPGFALSRYIIHAVGPLWKGGNEGESEKLHSAYISALRLAQQNGVQSVAFPLISSGIYGYPKQEAFIVAKRAILEYLKDCDLTVILVLAENFKPEIEMKERAELLSYMASNESKKRAVPKRILNDGRIATFSVCTTSSVSVEKDFELKELVKRAKETFSQKLLRFIDERNYSDVEVYKRANIDRKLFSKIRSDVNYRPTKKTTLSLAVALMLSVDETKDLLKCAGYALSDSNKADIIVEYFISRGIYDIFVINEALFNFDQPLLS